MTHPYELIVAERFGGLLSHGEHDPDGAACALEAASIARGRPWSDDPDDVELPDLRPLNDGPWTSDEARTEAMVPLVVALWDWPTWAGDRHQAWLSRVASRTTREVLPIVLRAVGLDAEAERCELEGTREEVWAALDASMGESVWARAAIEYAYDAWDDPDVAAQVAPEGAHVSGVDADDLMRLTCRIWTEEAVAG